MREFIVDELLELRFLQLVLVTLPSGILMEDVNEGHHGLLQLRHPGAQKERRFSSLCPSSAGSGGMTSAALSPGQVYGRGSSPFSGVTQLSHLLEPLSHPPLPSPSLRATSSSQALWLLVGSSHWATSAKTEMQSSEGAWELTPASSLGGPLPWQGSKMR